MNALDWKTNREESRGNEGVGGGRSEKKEKISVKMKTALV